MIVIGSPRSDVRFVVQSIGPVVYGWAHARRRTASDGDTHTSNTARMEVWIAMMVPQPVLQIAAAFFGHQVPVEAGRPQGAVVHGTKPFVIALHTTAVFVATFLLAKHMAIRASTIDGHTGDAVSLHDFLAVAVLISQQINPMAGIDILVVCGATVEQAVHLVSECIAFVAG